MRQAYIIIPRNKTSVSQTIETIFSLKEFQSRIKEFRIKYKIDKLSIKERKKFLKSGELIAEQKWRFDLSIIARDLGLSDEWLPVVFGYAITGKTYSNSDPEGIMIYTEITDVPKYTKTDYLIKIHKNTTEVDFKNAWKQIKRHFKLKNSKEKNSKNFDRDTFAYQLRKDQKLSYKDIRNILNENDYGKLYEPYIRSLVSKRQKKIDNLRTVYLKK